MDLHRGCLAKFTYLTRTEAKRGVRALARKECEEFYQYRCPNCGYYHVGHLVPAAIRARLRQEREFSAQVET